MSFFPFKNQNLRYDEKIVGQHQLFITETQNDADAANNLSLPAVALENHMLTDENFQILIELCSKSNDIYLINGKSDTKRIAEVGKTVATEGISVFILNLPKDANPSDDRLVQYLSANTVEKFNDLITQSTSFIQLLILQLPVDFLKAAPVIAEKILPLLRNIDSVTVKYYLDLIGKQTKTKIKLIEELVSQANDGNPPTEPVEEETDPEILAAASALSLDPALLVKRIDVISNNGVSGERKNIAIFYCALDSRLLMDQGIPGQNVIACKIAGHPGAGKSFTLMSVLRIYPKSAYVLITSGSERSLYYINKGIKHKCLVVMEAFQLSADRGDNEIAYTIRILLSEGKLNRLVTERDEKTNKWATKEILLEGPVSFITTTIENTLEIQLDDRLFTIHPDESIDQTKRIISNSAKQKAGIISTLDERVIRTWKAVHSSLEPVTIIIPYAEKIADYLTKKPKLPITARRAFNKVLNVIQAVTCVYQFQRERDNEGKVIATIADYLMSVQIVAEAFKENLGQMPRATSERLTYLTAQGHMAPKDIANHDGVSRTTISSWAKRLEQDGIVEWVDLNGNSFPNSKAAYAAKKAGKAHLQVSATASNPWSGLGLPMPNDIIDYDANWAPGGLEYERYNLHLNSDMPTVVTPNPAPVPASLGVTTFPASPGGTAWPRFSQPQPIRSFTEIDPADMTDEELYRAGISSLMESIAEDQSLPHDTNPVVDEEQEEHFPQPGDPDYVNPLI